MLEVRAEDKTETRKCIIQIILLLDRHSSHRLSETMYKARVVISKYKQYAPFVYCKPCLRIQSN